MVDLDKEVLNLIREMIYIEVSSDDILIDLGINSLMKVELIVLLEDTFKIQFNDSDLAPQYFERVQDIINLVTKYVGTLI